MREATGGGGPHTKRYYEGLCIFVKQARQLDSRMRIISETIPAQLVLNRVEHDVVRLKPLQWYDVSGASHAAAMGIAALHPSKTDFAVLKMNIAQFVDKGHLAGASLLMQ
jgi:hypothetical protein